MDPLDICVLSERQITRADIIMDVIIVGGLLMVDGGEADDKIIAVLKDDAIWGKCRDIHEIPKNLIERLQHYFLTYKMKLHDGDSRVEAAVSDVEIRKSYDAAHAKKVI
jgi:inorganic pyrophosphatase